MSHAHARAANLLGALSLAVADRIAETADSGPASGTAAAALVAIDGPAAGASIDALARIVGLSHSGAVRLVDRLSAAGLVERRPGADQRSAALLVTPSGRRAARRVLARREAAIEAVLAALATRDRDALARIAESLLAALGREPGEKQRICRLCDTEACGRPRSRCPVASASSEASI
jgi:DNA-binding MarR family transcriptional regulator